MRHSFAALVLAGFVLAGCAHTGAPTAATSTAATAEALASKKKSPELEAALAQFAKEEGRKVTAANVPLNEGRGAADKLLRDVAVLLGSATTGPATISRIQEDRFRMLLPLTGPDDAAAMIGELRIAVAGTSRRGRMILAQVGAAAFPDDGVTDEALYAIAEARMRADDPRAHDLLGTPDPDDHLPLRQIVERRSRATDEPTVERRRSAG